jgi:hypothetical protein
MVAAVAMLVDDGAEAAAAEVKVTATAEGTGDRAVDRTGCCQHCSVEIQVFLRNEHRIGLP